MKFTESQYIELSKRFNAQSLTGKLIFIKNHTDIFTLEVDDWNVRLRLENEAMNIGLDSHFNFPDTLSFELIQTICKLADLPVKKLK